MAKLAIVGGRKVRTRPFPARTPFGQREEELLLDAVRSQNLFGKSGRYGLQSTKSPRNSSKALRRGDPCGRPPGETSND